MRRFVVIAAFLFFFLPKGVLAHPGNTDSAGCHTCRTNCTERWGIPYGFYHTHYPVRACGAPPPTIVVTPTPKPAPKTIKSSPAPTPTPTFSPSPSPIIEGISTEEPSPSPSSLPEATTGDVVGRLAVGAGLLGLGYLGLRWLARMTAPKEPTQEI